MKGYDSSWNNSRSRNRSRRMDMILMNMTMVIVMVITIRCWYNSDMRGWRWRWRCYREKESSSHTVLSTLKRRRGSWCSWWRWADKGRLLLRQNGWIWNISCHRINASLQTKLWRWSSFLVVVGDSVGSLSQGMRDVHFRETVTDSSERRTSLDMTLEGFLGFLLFSFCRGRRFASRTTRLWSLFQQHQENRSRRKTRKCLILNLSLSIND